VTDRLIPPFAIGAFLAFTLSQAGMVVHWYRKRGHTIRMAVNAIGAIATGTAVLIVLVAKFIEGAWITAILIPGLIAVMVGVKKHYAAVDRAVLFDSPIRVENLAQPLVIVPLGRWTRITEKGLRFAMKLSSEVQAVHVDAEECREDVETNWQRNVTRPIAAAGRTVPQLVFIGSPYRFVLTPLVDHILREEAQHPERQIAVLIPELVVRYWWQTPLHNQRAQLLKLLLLLGGNQRIVVINIPWYL
jgi:hypothetical protein